MNVKLFLLILICLCGTGLSQSGSELKFADRIIRAEKRPVSSDDDEGFPAIEVVRVYIGRTAIGINKKFSAEDTWLGDLRIEVKNVSRETIKCVGLSLGLLADIDTLLQTHESWPRGVGFYRGQCDVRKHPNTALDLKPGRTIILEKKMPRAGMHQCSKRQGN